MPPKNERDVYRFYMENSRGKFTLASELTSEHQPN
jgi:hypothetical protein